MREQQRLHQIVCLRTIAHELHESRDEGLSRLIYYAAELLERDQLLHKDVVQEAIMAGEE